LTLLRMVLARKGKGVQDLPHVPDEIGEEEKKKVSPDFDLVGDALERGGKR